jgi:hypothetical protein
MRVVIERLPKPARVFAAPQMLVDDIGDVTITNDGATILKLLEVEHPAAKVLPHSRHLPCWLRRWVRRSLLDLKNVTAVIQRGATLPQILVELAELQDQEVGDGTTSVVIVAAELLKRANELVRQRIHPTSIISGYRMAMREARRRLSPQQHVCMRACAPPLPQQHACVHAHRLSFQAACMHACMPHVPNYIPSIAPFCPHGLGHASTGSRCLR